MWCLLFNWKNVPVRFKISVGPIELITMYGKLLQRFKKSYKDVQASVRTLRSTSKLQTKWTAHDKNKDGKDPRAEKEIRTDELNFEKFANTCDVATVTGRFLITVSM